ncbi:MAG: HesA/MoeB/ThiF family protein [Bauldia sp.]|nr:HesA/MoeB/ThiF family protein [Bauldia sp.]MCW5717487.1 HesA/MoeB/ThiF family protein [Bauldia sp.]
MPPVFSPDEIDRYARHLVLRDIGGPGQQRLKRSSLLVIGAGGLGSPVLAYCAAAGVGRIGIADDDRVALSNLQRQVLYQTADVGRHKAECAAAALGRLNPHTAVDVISRRVTADNAAALMADYDVVADCTDSAEARYLISDAAYFARKPLVTAAVIRFDGHVTALKPYLRAADGNPNPTYRCLFPRAPDGEVEACAAVGVLGVLPGLVGSIQALEIVKELSGLGTSLVGRLAMVDGRDMRVETIQYRWDPDNPLTGRAASQRPPADPATASAGKR